MLDFTCVIIILFSLLLLLLLLLLLISILLLLLLLLLSLLLLQVKPVNVNYNYFTQCKTSSLNLKIIWSKRVSFFVFLRCRKFIRRSHGLRLSVSVKTNVICFYWNGWMKIDCSFWMYKSCGVTYKSCQRERKINYKSWFLSIGKLETEIALPEKPKKKKKKKLNNEHPTNH